MTIFLHSYKISRGDKQSQTTMKKIKRLKMSTTKLEWYVGNGEKEFIKKKLVREHSSRKVCFLSALNSKQNWWIEKWTNEQQLTWKPFKEQPTAFNYISIWKFSRAAVFFCCSNFELSPCEHSEHSDGWLILDWNVSYF